MFIGVDLPKTPHIFNHSKSTKARKLKFCPVVAQVLGTTCLKSQSCISIRLQNIILVCNFAENGVEIRCAYCERQAGITPA